MAISTIADGLTRRVENAADTVSQTFMEPVVRLGVTGLSRAGKTVFITSLVANLQSLDRMPGLTAAARGRIQAAYLQPQPDDTVPRFDYEAHLANLTGPDPRWPESTRAISQLRLSFRLQSSGLLHGLQRPRILHLDIVDYPGEWLLDLGLLNQSYESWCETLFARLPARTHAKDFLHLASSTDATAPFDEIEAKTLASVFTDYLHAGSKAGLADCTPGRFLLPGDLAGSPVLSFAPLPKPESLPRKSLWYEMERRFEAYKSRVVRPFFRDHFARIDRQIVLCDLLGALNDGPEALEDLRSAMANVLKAFRPGTNSFLARLLRGRRVEKILFAATKADHLHHTQHPNMSRIIDALLTEARNRASFAGAKTAALSLASIRATTEESREHDSQKLDCVRGARLMAMGQRGPQVAFYPGHLPEDPAELLMPSRDGAQTWRDAEYGSMNFAPPAGQIAANGLPHIRLDRAVEFLLGDRL
ncbi:MAG: YcjX family protein [Pseudomonadota bacterium]